MSGYQYRGKIRDLTEPVPEPTPTPAPAGDRCGTPKGYKWHLRHDEDICGPCRAAQLEYMREWRAVNRPAKPRPVGTYDPEHCGSDKGYHRHRRQGTTPCTPCRAGHAAVAAEYAARRAA